MFSVRIGHPVKTGEGKHRVDPALVRLHSDLTHDACETRQDIMSYENLIVETHGRVGVIRLNRPQALNALNSALMAELMADCLL